MVSFGNGSNEKNIIITCCENGCIDTYDLRVSKSVLHYNLNVQRGLVTCMNLNKDEK